MREMGVKRLIANCLSNACSPNAPFARLRSRREWQKRTATTAVFRQPRIVSDQANDTLRLDFWNAKPKPTKPNNIIAHVPGSGTAPAALSKLTA
jgi:hypothetical protein